MTDDALRILVIEALHAETADYRRVVRTVARNDGDIEARRLESALVFAAREIDATIRQAGSPTDEARNASRLALRLATDIDRLARGRPAGNTIMLSDLIASWSDPDDIPLRP